MKSTEQFIFTCVITGATDEHQLCVPNHRQPECFFKTLFGLTNNELICITIFFFGRNHLWPVECYTDRRIPLIKCQKRRIRFHHYKDVVMGTVASQITSVSIVCQKVCSGADQRKHQTSASLAYGRAIRRWPVDSTHKGPVTRKMLPFDDVIMML